MEDEKSSESLDMAVRVKGEGKKNRKLKEDLKNSRANVAITHVLKQALSIGVLCVKVGPDLDHLLHPCPVSLSL